QIDACAQIMVDTLRETAKELDFKVYAYVVMPEHVHIVLHPQREEYFVEGILHFMKRRASSRILMHCRRAGHPVLKELVHVRQNGMVEPRVWLRGGGYDRNLFVDRTIYNVIDYIHLNPVRRGLCERPSAWPWSSAKAYEEMDKSQIDFYDPKA
ncbi:MAG: transposase, partial [Armatimonadota bacterium]